jgi:hypothetical protein
MNENRFVSVVDNTDHFAFACSECEVLAKVTQMLLVKSPRTIFISLKCPKCGTEDSRKMYADLREMLVTREVAVSRLRIPTESKFLNEMQEVRVL